MSAEHDHGGGGGGSHDGNFIVEGLAESAAPVWSFLFDFIPVMMFGWLDAVL